MIDAHSTGSRSVVVTGAGRGIGRGIATALTEDGWRVVGVDHRDPEQPAPPYEDLVIGDTREVEVHRRAAAAATAIAPLGGWVNNAGVTRATPLHLLSDPHQGDQVARTIAEVLDINGRGYLWGAAVAVETFLEQGTPGAIVNIGSIHGRAAWSDHAAYEFTKGGVDAMTRSLAVSYGSKGIRANSVAPGRIRTETVAAWIDSADDPAERQRDLDTGPPLGRMGGPAEIGDVVTFLLSERASYLTGQSIAVDGGWTAQFGTPPPIT